MARIIALLLLISSVRITHGFWDFQKIKKNIFDTVKRQPDVSEDSSVASGKITKHATIQQLEYVRTYNPLLTFQEGKETHYMTKRCKKGLLELACKTNMYWGTNCTIQVTRGFYQVKTDALRENSLHYEGRALDIRLVNSSVKEKDKSGTGTCGNDKLKELAWIAKFVVKFDFVELKTRHIHVSCRKGYGFSFGK